MATQIAVVATVPRFCHHPDHQLSLKSHSCFSKLPSGWGSLIPRLSRTPDLIFFRHLAGNAVRVYDQWTKSAESVV